VSCSSIVNTDFAVEMVVSAERTRDYRRLDVSRG
jgi:hypothetical protein